MGGHRATHTKFDNEYEQWMQDQKNKIKKGKTYTICENNAPIGVYTYVGTKFGVHNQENMSLFLMFQICERIEGFEFSEDGLVEKSISIRCIK